MKKVIIALLSYLFTVSLSLAQGTQTLRGTVTEQETGYPMIGVAVSLTSVSPAQIASTDENGEFSFAQVPTGRHELQFQMIGYKDKVLSNILVQQGKETVLAVSLEEVVIETQEVVIKIGKDKTEAINEMSTTSTRQFSVEETGRYAGSLNDPSRMAANFAGVSGANDGRNDIIIRGNSPLGLLWRMDGLPIPNPNHFGSSGSTGGPVSMLNNSHLANSDFMTGAFPAEYGNALSGVFDLNMRKGNNQKREYLGQIGFNGFELGAEGPFTKKSKASYLINYRYSTLGFFKLIGLQFGTGAAVPQYQDLSMKINIPTQKAGRFSLFAIGGLSYIELLDSKKDTTNSETDLYGNGGFDVYYRANTGMAGINHTYFYNTTTSHKLGLVFSGQYNKIISDSLDAVTFTQPFDNFRADRKEGRITFTAQWNKKFNAHNTLHFGTYISRLGYRTSDELYPQHLAQWIELRGSNGSALLSEAFVQWKHKFTDKFSINTGLHGQHLSMNGASALEPRVGFKYQLKTKHSFTLGAGVHNQMQPLLVYFSKTRLSDGSYLETNKDLGFTRALHLVAGYHVAFSEFWRVKLEAYSQYIDKAPVESHPSYFSMLNAGADFVIPDNDSLVNKGTGTNKGLELTLERFLNKGFYMLATTSLFESKYKGSDGIERNTAFNGNYVVNVLIGKEVKLGKRTTFVSDLKATYSGGRRYLPLDLAASLTEQKTVLDYSNPYAQRYTDYFRADVKVEIRKESKSGKFTQLFTLNVQNVTNNKNIFSQAFDRRTQKVVNIYQLGFMPIPQYKILF